MGDEIEYLLRHSPREMSVVELWSELGRHPGEAWSNNGESVRWHHVIYNNWIELSISESALSCIDSELKLPGYEIESNHMRVRSLSDLCCPLCGDGHVTTQEKIVGSELNALYIKQFAIAEAVKSQSIDYLICHGCGLGFFEPMEAGGEALYERLQSFDWYYMADKYEFEVAKRFIPERGTVLEVGAGRAAFSKVVGASRYTGLEFNDGAIEGAREAGIRLIKETVHAHAAEGYTYDNVVSFQVLEHVLEPGSFLRCCVKCLKHGGTLILGVPALDGFAGGAVNHALDMPPHHVTRWSGETLRKLAPLLGVDLVEVNMEPIAKYHRVWARKTVWESRLRSLFGIRPRLLDTSPLARVLALMASVLAKVVPISIDGLAGHTVVAVYRKP